MFRLLLLLCIIARASCNFWEESGLQPAVNRKGTIDYDVRRGENGPSTDWQASAASLGLELVPAGETYPYHSVFRHLMVLNKPDIKDYEPMLSSIQIKCQQFNVKIAAPDANQTGKAKRIYNETVNAYRTYNRLFYKRCARFQEVVRGAFERDLEQAFSELLPVNRGEIDGLLEGAMDLAKPMEVPDASIDEKRQILEHFELAHQLTVELGKNKEGEGKNDVTEKPVEEVVERTSEAPSTEAPVEVSSESVSSSTILSAPLDVQLVNDSVTAGPVDGVNKVSENDIFADFRSGRKRRQFDVVSFATAATALVVATSAQASAGVALARQEVLQKQVEELMEAKLRTDRDTVVATEELLGISEINTNNTHAALLSLTQTQTIQDILGHEIEQISFALSRLSKKTEVSVAVLSNLIQQLDLSARVQFILLNMRQRLANYELAMNALRAGFLPTQFVDYTRLKGIMHKIESSLPPSLYLGIDYSDINRFYTQRLAKFAVVGNKVILRLMIPLSRTPALQPDQLFMVNTLPVPLPDKWRKKYNVHPEAISPKMQLNLKAAFWVFRNGRLIGVTSRNKMLCEQSADEMSCMSFNVQPNDGKSRCIQAFMAGDINKASERCDFTIVEAVYTPVPISNGSYVCHRSRFVEFREVCETGSRGLTISAYAATFTIPKNCTLMVGDQEFPSFWNGTLIRNQTFDYSIEGSAMLPVQSIGHIETYQFHSFKVFEYNRTERILFTPETEIINQKVRKVKRAIESMQGTIHQMEDNIKEVKRAKKINFKALDTVIFDVLVLVLVVTGIRRLRFPALLGLCIPHVIVLNPADAFQLPQKVNEVLDAVNASFSLSGNEVTVTNNTSDTNVPFENRASYSLSPSYYDFEDLIAVLRLSVVLTAVICSLLQRSLFVTVISTLKGIVRCEGDHRFFFHLTFKRPYHTCWRFFDQLVIITVPLVNTIPKETVSVELTRSRFTFTIKKKTGYLSVPEEFEVRGFTSQGIQTFATKLKMRIPLNSIQWAMNEKPRGINQTFAGRVSIEATSFARQLRVDPSSRIVKVTQM